MAALLLSGLAPLRAEVVLVAVASNFAAPFQRIAQDFTALTGHQVTISTGSTGKFHAQVRNGAPYAVLIAADDETPAKLIEDGLAVPGTSFTYALGKLALWSARPGFVDPKGEVLRRGRFEHLALADPRLAPYGAAGVEVLQKMGLWASLSGKVVQATNIAQAHQFISSGNAELGFVAWSQVAAPGQPSVGSWWQVPAEWHAPIRQNAVLLLPGARQPAAQALLQHLRSEAARAVIQSWGYGL